VITTYHKTPAQVGLRVVRLASASGTCTGWVLDMNPDQTARSIRQRKRAHRNAHSGTVSLLRPSAPAVYRWTN
jgi:hypothetical protein